MDKVAMAEKLHSILRMHATNQQAVSMIAEIVPIIEEVVTAEREADIRICERIYFEANVPLSKDALNCAIAIRGRTAAPKAEVSE